MQDANQTQKTPIGIWVLIVLETISILGVVYEHIRIGENDFFISLLVVSVCVFVAFGLYFRVNILRKIIVFMSFFLVFYNIFLGAITAPGIFFTFFDETSRDIVLGWMLFPAHAIISMVKIWYLTRTKIKLWFGDQKTLLNQSAKNPEIF